MLIVRMAVKQTTETTNYCTVRTVVLAEAFMGTLLKQLSSCLYLAARIRIVSCDVREQRSMFDELRPLESRRSLVLWD